MLVLQMFQKITKTWDILHLFNFWQGLNTGRYVVPVCLWGLGNQHRRGVCTLFFRIPIDKGMAIPQIASFDHDTYHHIVKYYTCLLFFLAHLVFGDVQSR